MKARLRRRQEGIRRMDLVRRLEALVLPIDFYEEMRHLLVWVERLDVQVMRMNLSSVN